MYLLYDGLFQRFRRAYFAKILDTYASTPGYRLLDYGCGPGDMLQECVRRNISAHGLDSSRRSVEMARQRGLQVDLGTHDEMPDHFDDFDVIFLHSVLEHVRHPLDLIEALAQRLSERGVLIVSAPTPEPSFWDDPTHVRPYTPKALHTIAQLCDLEIVEINYVFAFLLGMRLSSPLFFRVLNLFPAPLGTNVMGVYRRQAIGNS